MNRDQQNFHAMLRSVVLCYTEHEGAAAAPPMLATLRGSLTAQEAALSTERRRQGDPVAGLAANKEQIQAGMVQWTMAAVGLGQSLAGVTRQSELARQLTVSASELLNMPDLDCRNRCEALLGLLSAAPLRTQLIPYGLSEAMLETADDLIGEFSELIGKPRQLVIARAGATGRIATIIQETRTFLDEVLDPFMRQYGLPMQTPEAPARQALFAAYTQSRIIVSLGGRGDSAGESSSSSSAGS